MANKINKTATTTNTNPNAPNNIQPIINTKKGCRNSTCSKTNSNRYLGHMVSF